MSLIAGSTLDHGRKNSLGIFSARVANGARGVLRLFLSSLRRAFVAILAVLLVVSSAQAFIAFEAHVVNVEATVAQIDPPVISPPGGQYEASVDVTIDDSDPDATHIFYTLTPGLDPSVADDPVCGDLLGGPKPIGPFTLSEDTVVKAIACDGDTGSAHQSLVTTEVYDIITPYGAIFGHKYHDLDQSGTLTDGDFPIQGWAVKLFFGVDEVGSTVTDEDGYYRFDTLAPGSYTVSEESRDGWLAVTPQDVAVDVAANDDLTVNFFNFDTGFACVPKVISFPADLAVQAAGATSGNDDVDLANNVTVNGDVSSNDEIEKIGGNGPRTINGDATVTNTIDSGITVTGTTTTGAPTASLPDAMIAEWQARAADGGTVNGSFTFPNNTVGLVMGPSEIMGDVTFGSSNGVTIKGPLYIHGDLDIGSNTTITQDAGFGNQFVAIVVDGKIDIDSNVAFNGSGASGAFLLISTHAAVSGDDAAIETSSNNSDLGDVVLYASNGDIHIRSNRTLLAAFATHGTGSDSDDNGAVRIDSNVTVNYRALPGKISCGPRQPFETTSHVLINEFMPNPSGSDAGTAGLPLDGEWVELFNPTAGAVDVAGYVLYDEDNTHALPVTTANTDTGGTVVPSLGHLVVYRDGDADFQLNNSGGDTARLFSGFIGAGGVLVDSHTYARSAPDDKSFARVPDGATNWVDPDATPGDTNLFFFEVLAGPGIVPFEPPELPPLNLTAPFIEPPVVEPVVLGESTEEPAAEGTASLTKETIAADTEEPSAAPEESSEAAAPEGSSSASGEESTTAAPEEQPAEETAPTQEPSGSETPASEPAPAEEATPEETPAPTEESAPVAEPQPEPSPTFDPEPAAIEPAPLPEPTP